MSLVAQTDDFRRDVMDAIRDDSRYTVFHTDDDVFFRSPPSPPRFSDNFAAFGFRLRLNRPTAIPSQSSADSVVAIAGPYIAWNWTRARDDSAYPCRLMATSLPQMSCCACSKARALRIRTNWRRSSTDAATSPSGHGRSPRSSVVSIPVNVVSSSHRNRSGGEPDDRHRAQRAFLANERIDLDAMDFASVRAAHHELTLEFSDPVSDAESTLAQLRTLPSDFESRRAQSRNREQVTARRAVREDDLRRPSRGVRVAPVRAIVVSRCRTPASDERPRGRPHRDREARLRPSGVVSAGSGCRCCRPVISQETGGFLSSQTSNSRTVLPSRERRLRCRDPFPGIPTSTSSATIEETTTASPGCGLLRRTGRARRLGQSRAMLQVALG